MQDIQDFDDMPAGSFFFYLRRPSGKPLSIADDGETTIRNRIETGEISKADGLWELVDAHKDNGNMDGVRECITEILDTNPDSEMSARCHHALGCLAERCSDYPSAVLHYRTALSFQPTNTSTSYWAHNNLGYSLCMLKQYAEAVIECKIAVDIEPHLQNAYKNLGIALTGLEDIAGAASCFYRATKANAADPRSLRLLETLYENHKGLLDRVEGIQDMLEDCRSCVYTYESMLTKFS